MYLADADFVWRREISEIYIISASFYSTIYMRYTCIGPILPADAAHKRQPEKNKIQQVLERKLEKRLQMSRIEDP